MARDNEKYKATHRSPPKVAMYAFQKASEYFGVRTFDCLKDEAIAEPVRMALAKVATSHRSLSFDHAKVVAKAALEWAMAAGATIFAIGFNR